MLPDSVVDDLVVEAKLLVEDALSKEDGIMTVVIWKDYDPEVAKKKLEEEAARVANALKELEQESDDKGKEVEESTVTPDKELLDLQVEYEVVFGKKPHHMKKAETLRDEIKKKK